MIVDHKVDNASYKLHMNDLPRNENSHEILFVNLKNADIILLVYDVTNEKSFKDIEKWFEAIKQTCVDRSNVLSILANINGLCSR